MKIKTKYQLNLIVAIIFIGIAAVIFILADGLKRLYSGLFFLVMGLTIMARAIYHYRNRKKNIT